MPIYGFPYKVCLLVTYQFRMELYNRAKGIFSPFTGIMNTNIYV